MPATLALPPATLATIRHRLLSTLQPRRIILFGSRAHGTSGADSDVDLLVLLDELPKSRRQSVIDGRAAFAPDRSAGFTLIEMAIVLVIIGLLLGGLLMPLATQMDQQRIDDTRRSLDQARDALIGFALANGRLPCPADPTIAAGAANAGVENRTPLPGPQSCVNVAGVWPWATLGLAELDAWGRRYTYRVTALYADDIAAATFGCAPPTPPANASFALCSTGDMTVRVAIGGTTLADDLPAVIVSHGENGIGAWLPGGAQMAGAANDEQENADADTAFVQRTLAETGDPATRFDDQLAWVSRNILYHRMVAGGLLP